MFPSLCMKINLFWRKNVLKPPSECLVPPFSVILIRCCVQAIICHRFYRMIHWSEIHWKLSLNKNLPEIWISLLWKFFNTTKFVMLFIWKSICCWSNILTPIVYLRCNYYTFFYFGIHWYVAQNIKLSHAALLFG